MSQRRHPTEARLEGITRRVWLGEVAALGLAGVAQSSQADEPAHPPEEARREAGLVKAAVMSGLRGVGVARSEHYFAVGNAPERFRGEALDLCEKLAASYKAHFEARGFPVAFPPEKMAMVILADRKSYETFKKEPVSDDEGGHYDLVTDRLVVHDFRGSDAKSGTRLNTFTLVHEGLHQLTYDTGLLHRVADVPRAISEGFATYGETWRKENQRLGQVNRPRLDVLRHPGLGEWIEMGDLLTRDALFDEAASAQYAYAEAWILIHEHMKTPARAAKLRDYLDRLRSGGGARKRREIAAETLGDLTRLDRESRKAAKSLLER